MGGFILRRYMNELEKLRKEIDQCDHQLLTLLSNRMELVKKVGDYKQKHTIPPLDQGRWDTAQQMRLAHAQKLGLDHQLTIEVFDCIHMHALRLEKERS